LAVGDRVAVRPVLRRCLLPDEAGSRIGHGAVAVVDHLCTGGTGGSNGDAAGRALAGLARQTQGVAALVGRAVAVVVVTVARLGGSVVDGSIGRRAVGGVGVKVVIGVGVGI